MRATITWWDLTGSGQTVDTLREHLDSGATLPWQQVPGLRMKFWFADPEHNRWGAVMVWEDGCPGDRPLPPNRALELIGRPPTERVSCEVQALVQAEDGT